jgi:hypothetical protein
MNGVLLTIGVVFLVLWLLGLISAYTFGGFIHVALVIGLILLIVWIVRRLRFR